jgi:hypothetical protein
LISLGAPKCLIVSRLACHLDAIAYLVREQLGLPPPVNSLPSRKPPAPNRTAGQNDSRSDQRHRDVNIAFHLFLLPENTMQSDTCSKVNQRHASLMVMLIVVSVPIAFLNEPNSLFVVGFPLHNNPAATKQIASTIPAITSRDVMIASRRAAHLLLPLLQPVATGGERKRCDHVAVCVKQRRGSLDRKLIQVIVERHRAHVVKCAQEVATRVP